MPTGRVVNVINYFNVYYQNHSLLHHSLVPWTYFYTYQYTLICSPLSIVLYTLYDNPIMDLHSLIRHRWIRNTISGGIVCGTTVSNT